MLNVIEKERPEGIIVQFGGQTPLKLATALDKALTENPIPAASGEGSARRGCAWRELGWGSTPQAAPAVELPQAAGIAACTCAPHCCPSPPPGPPPGNGNVRIWGTSPDAIDEAEDRDRWMALLNRLDIRQPEGGVATNEAEALGIANKVGGGVGWGGNAWCGGQ